MAAAIITGVAELPQAEEVVPGAEVALVQQLDHLVPE